MISVCLATYNGEKYLQAQLDSILPQLQTGDELLISDDGSTDGTLDILPSIPCRFALYKNNFRSPSRNFEFLMKTASGKVIVPCDQDDIWLPHKLQLVRQELKGKKRTCLLMNAFLIDEQGRKTGSSTFEKWGTRSGFWRNLLRNTYMGSSMAFTADLLQTALPFPDGIAMHDWWLGLLAEKTGTVKLIEQPAMMYRLHGNNASLQGSGFRQKLSWRLHMLREIRKRLSNE